MPRPTVSDKAQPISISLKQSTAEDLRKYCTIIGRTPSQIVSEYVEGLLQPYRDYRTGKINLKKAVYVESEDSIPQLCYMVSELGVVETKQNGENDQYARLGSYLIALNGTFRKVPGETVQVLEEDSAQD